MKNYLAPCTRERSVREESFLLQAEPQHSSRSSRKKGEQGVAGEEDEHEEERKV
jgi:hypothetical protein